eukprot:365226-Chlamydomonas_euryale.AAC.12
MPSAFFASSITCRQEASFPERVGAGHEGAEGRQHRNPARSLDNIRVQAAAHSCSLTTACKQQAGKTQCHPVGRESTGTPLLGLDLPELRTLLVRSSTGPRKSKQWRGEGCMQAHAPKCGVTRGGQVGMAVCAARHGLGLRTQRATARRPADSRGRRAAGTAAQMREKRRHRGR